MAVLISIILLVIVVTLFAQFLWNREAPGYPPGPFAWPIFGNLFSIVGGDGFYSKILALRRHHGDIFRLKLGEMSMIVVFGFKNVHEALVEKGELFKNRPNWLYIPTNVIKNRGIFWTNGSLWHKLTSLLVSAQNDKYRLEHLQSEILKEFDETFKEIKISRDEPINPQEMMTRSVFNITSTIAFGKRYEHDDPEFHILRENIMFMLTSSKSGSPANMFPLIARLSSSKFNEVIQREEAVFQIFRNKVTEHKEKMNKSQLEDYIDVYLNLSEEERGQEEYSEPNFFRSIVDLFVGGADTSTSMLLWHLVYMAKYQDVQKKCQEEIDKVVGKDRPVRTEDRTSLPYTEATFMELGRIAGSIVTTALRTNTEETKIGEYTIPKDSIVICDLRQPGIDEEFWKDPTELRPERFLDSIKDKPYHPFGLGPRQCVAKIAAESMLFLFLTNTLRTFKLEPGDGTDMSLDSFFTGVSLRPKHPIIRFMERT